MEVLKELKMNNSITDKLINEVADKVLDSKEKVIFSMLLENLTYSEIGEKIGVCREKARALACRTVRKVRRELMCDGRI